MAPFARRFLLSLIGITLFSASLAAGEPTRHVITVGFVDLPWAIAVDTTGYSIRTNGMKPDGRRYLLATDRTTGLTLSITLETVTGTATREGCAKHLNHLAPTADASHREPAIAYDIPHIDAAHYITTATRTRLGMQQELFACVAKDHVYADIHLTRTNAASMSDAPLQEFFAHLHVVSAPTPNSLDFFQAGSVPYLQRRYAEAIPYYAQALALEQTASTLPVSIRALLIYNLGMAYRLVGDLPQAKAVFEYGVTQDSTDPLLHYHLAHTYAGMNDRPQAMQCLHRAFQLAQAHRDAPPLPDPRHDALFRRFMLDPSFRSLAETLMQPAI